MPFQIEAELRYSVMQPSTVLLNLHALSTPNQILKDESFAVTKGVECEFFPLETGQNRYVRLETGDLGELLISYSVTAETKPDSRQIREIESVPIAKVERAALRYLFPSRYCQSDCFWRFANKTFGAINHPLAQAEAIADWIFENIDYVPGISDTSTTARETLTQRAGVCRDFAHLGVALCRALSIPARYFTGYAWNMEPQDFHACFEVCVGNEWFIFDPTRMACPDGLVRIATGRDAADASLATIFGSMQLDSMRVSCVSGDFRPIPREQLANRAILLEP